MPALDELLDAIRPADLRRWKRHQYEFKITQEEQTCQPVLTALAVRDVDAALYAVMRARRAPDEPAKVWQGAEPELSPRSLVDEAVAGAVSQLSADRVKTTDAENLADMRQSVFGRQVPLSRSEAWDFLRKGEEIARPIPWERLHAGDRSLTWNAAQTGSQATLAFRDDSGRDHQFRADPNSPLETLWFWANILFTTYNWPRSQAAWFILTGDAPQLLPVTVAIERGVLAPLTSLIILTIPAYVGVDTLLAAHAVAHRRLIERRSGPLAIERHAMADFVAAQADPEGVLPSWAELWQRWNRFAPRTWRLKNRKLRYPNWRSMLDSYRREMNARASLAIRLAALSAVTSRRGSTPRSRPRPARSR